MKIKISQLNPNPFKKQISKGKLNREQIDKIKANIKELGFFDALPIFKKDNKYYLVAGHHRLQALKEVYGKDYEVEVILNNYNEDQIFRGMVIENITQRTNDFMELNQNVVAIENYLNSHKEVLRGLRESRHRQSRTPKGSYQEEYKNKATSTDISFWIDKNSGEVLSHDVVNQNLNIYHKLDPELRKDVEKKHDKSKLEREEDNLNYTQAIILSGVDDKEEQKELAKVLKKTREQRVREQAKLISKYKHAPEEVKEQIKKGIVDLADIDLAITQYNLRQKKNSLKVENINRKINGLIDRVSFSITDTESNLKSVIKDIVIISKYINDMSEKQKARLSMKINSFGGLLSKLSDLMDNIKEKIQDGL